MVNGARIWARGVSVAIGLCALSAGTHAQTLEQQYQALISNNCAGIGTTTPGGGATPLDALCTGGIIVFTAIRADAAIAAVTQDAIPSAGGGGSSQSSGIALTQERIRTRRGQTRPPEQSSDLLSQYASTDSTSIAQELGSNGGVSLFYTTDYERREKDLTTFEDGYDSQVGALSLGLDKLYGDKAVAGLVLNYQVTDGDFDGGGGFQTDSYGVLTYGAYFPTDRTSVELVLGYARKNYDVTRFVSFADAASAIFVLPSPVKSNTDGNEYSVGVAAGYAYPVGRFTISPRVGLDFVHVDVDGFSERGATGLELRFDDRSQTSLQSSLGVQLSAAFSTSYAVFLPQIGFDWIHEFQNDQQSLDVQFAGDLRATPTKFSFRNEEPDRDFFNAKIGLVTILPNGWKPYAEFRALLGHDFFNSYGGALGIRFEL